MAEFFLGHDIDSNHYNKFMKYEPWYPVQEYRKALPWLNVLSEDPRKVDRTLTDGKLEASEAKVDALSRQLADMRKKMDRFEQVLGDPDMLETLLQSKNKK